MALMKLIFFVVYSFFIPTNYGSLLSMKERLISWVEITNFELENSLLASDLYNAQISTNDDSISVLNLSLKKSEGFYNPRLSYRLNECFFEGHVTHNQDEETRSSSSVRLKFCSGALSGLVHFGNDVWNLHTEPDQSWIMFTNYMIFKDNSTEIRCGSTGSKVMENSVETSLFSLIAHTDDENDRSEMTRARRSSNQNADKFVEIVIFHDYEYFEKYGLSEERVNERAIEMIHDANVFFSEVKNPKVHLTLLDVVIWKSADEKPDDFKHDTIGDVLGPFLNWRQDNLDMFLNHDNGIFISGAKYTGGVVGMAHMATLCRESHSGSVLSDHSLTVGVMAGTLAHELGHNFNLGHNPTSATDECACEQGKTPCVMNAGISTVPVRFTECQLKRIQEWVVGGNAPCLNNRPELTFGDPFCGDSFVNQPSEECDCGPAKTCEDTCCNATTCKLIEDADCSSFDLCCDQSCKIMTEGSVCREDTSECDLPEYCDGRSSSCPQDVYIQNGQRCKNNDLASHCYYGQCLTVYDQCLNVFTPQERIEKVTDERCWARNERGNEYGNCGLSTEMGNSFTFHECSPTDSRCGKLQCATKDPQGLDVSWMPGMKGTQYSGTFDDLSCHLVDSFKPYSDSVDDFSYVQDGTWCADESICVDQKCINITNIPGLKICPQRCNGNGLCNSNNNCHCDVGWEPPLCDVPGNGGSLDSGPASKTPDTSSASRAILVLFLLIIPIFIIAAVVLFVFRHPIKKFAREKYNQFFSTFPASVPQDHNRGSPSRKGQQSQSGKNRRDKYSFKPGAAVSSSQQSQHISPKGAPDEPTPKKRLPQASDFAIQFDSVLFKPSDNDVVTSWGAAASDGSAFAPVPAPRALPRPNANNQLAFNSRSQNAAEGGGLAPPPPQSVSLRNFAAY